MSTTGEEHHRSHTAGHIVMGLVAGALALAAAYLWLSDGSKSWSFTLKLPAPTSVAVVIAPPADSPSVMASSTQAAPKSIPHAALPTPVSAESAPTSDSAESAPTPVDQTVSVDAQVAADAAAVGMTARVRPSTGQ